MATFIRNDSVADWNAIRSEPRRLQDAPRQGLEGAPYAWLEIDPALERALSGLAPGDELVVVTWLHLVDCNNHL